VQTNVKGDEVAFALCFENGDTIFLLSVGTHIQDDERGVMVNRMKIRANLEILFQVPAVLYGCKSWSRILRKEHKLRVVENKVLRRIYRLQKLLELD
jgi:hypothetical protein